MKKSLSGNDYLSKLLRAFEHKCVYCSCEINKDNRTRDHIIPKSILHSCGLKDGHGGLDNLLLSCRSCNTKKSHKNFFEFINELPNSCNVINNVNRGRSKLGLSKIDINSNINALIEQLHSNSSNASKAKACKAQNLFGCVQIEKDYVDDSNSNKKSNDLSNKNLKERIDCLENQILIHEERIKPLEDRVNILMKETGKYFRYNIIALSFSIFAFFTFVIYFSLHY